MQGHALELSRRGVEVAALGIEDHHISADLPGWAPITPTLFPPLSKRLALAPNLANALTQGQFDIIHQHGLWQYPSVAVSQWRRRTRGPVIISTQGMLEPWALKRSQLKKFAAATLFERANLTGAACIHCSAAEVQGIRAYGLTNPVAVIPNGVQIPPLEAKVPQDRSRTRTMLYLGRLHPKKGICETVEAWSHLSRLAPEIFARWRLVIAGWDDGGHEDVVRRRIKELQLQDHVTLVGPIFGEEKARAYHDADAFILASHSEGFPMAILEAWAHTLPVFMTLECNIPEGFTSDAAVRITTDPENIAVTLAQQLNAPDIEEMGLNGRRLVQEQFTWPAVTDQLLSVYLWVLGRAAQPACVSLA